MYDHNNNYTDNSFNLYQAYSYSLLLQVDLNSFSYAFVHQKRLLVYAQNCDLDELAHPKKLSEILTATYKKVVIGLPASGLSLVPKSLFAEGHAADFARLLDVRPDEKVFAQALDDENNIIYKTPGHIASAVEKFGFENTFYGARGWIRGIAESRPSSSDLYIEIGKNAMQFLYFHGKSIRFYNSFEFKNEEELVYFTSFVCEELNLKPRETTLVLSGDIIVDDKNMRRLGDFFPKIEINRVKVLELPGQIPSHKLLSLSALSLCGS
ncbi:MAG TPA: DUF3822 family protein [Mucilaginibacter sp.]|jgi:hypothetical protein|nr:DUF3822 family protein [Mucilaginibacter sp.]